MDAKNNPYGSRPCKAPATIAVLGEAGCIWSLEGTALWPNHGPADRRVRVFFSLWEANLSDPSILEIPNHGGPVAIIADLHFKSYSQYGCNPFASLGLEACFHQQNLDALIVAGDLSDIFGPSLQDALAYLTRYVPADRIFVLPGNHDYYNTRLDDDAPLRELVRAHGSWYVQKAQLRHRGDRYFCATLWTDFNVLGDPYVGKEVAQRLMRDYKVISIAAPGGDMRDVDVEQAHRLRPITPDDTIAVHQNHRDWLTERLAEPHFSPEGRTFVVSHHGPHLSAAGPTGRLTSAFHSNLEDLLRANDIDCWYFGHSHRRLSAMIAGTRIQNVSLGYPHEKHGDVEDDLTRVCFVPATRQPLRSAV